MKKKRKTSEEINEIFAKEHQHFGKLLKSVRKACNMSAAEYAKLADIHINSQSNYENDKRDPSVDYLIQFSGFLKVSFWQLMARRVELSNCPEEHKDMILSHIDPYRDHLLTCDEQAPKSVTSSQVTKACLQLMAEHQFNPNMKVLKQNGDSMAPTIKHGDTLFVDSNIKTLNEGDIFVFQFADVYSAKRVQLVPGGNIMLVSDNSNFHPVNMTNGSLNKNMIMGKLVSTISHF